TERGRMLAPNVHIDLRIAHLHVTAYIHQLRHLLEGIDQRRGGRTQFVQITALQDVAIGAAARIAADAYGRWVAEEDIDALHLLGGTAQLPYDGVGIGTL